MSHLVDEKIRQTGREDEIQGLLARGFRFLFTFVPQDGSDGCCGEVGASLYNPNTRQTVPIFSLNLVEDMVNVHPPYTGNGKRGNPWRRRVMAVCRYSQGEWPRRRQVSMTLANKAN